MALTDKLTAIGDAIRSKTGSSDLLTLDAMTEAINNLQTSDAPTMVFQDIKSYRTSTSSAVTFDISSFIGTSDNKPFFLAARGATGSSTYGLAIYHYDGAGTFTMVSTNKNASGYIGATAGSKCSISAGVVTITTNATIIANTTGPDLLIYCV